ncbi:MAG: mismatch-specific DNA-glycosylase [Chloroflexi bacterium]|nr:mismatch-specific DNA-glycosylase [Chloroflexota bacterium]MDA1146759.1 mismatch-specific DNA-glycosylase [Chloroflexota bacterium]MQC82871.1 mismatch-specific DNA-glycosylase [Chloroflexota bacterium]
MTAIETLPDLLVPGLDLVFVGINPGERSALAGHYYAHPGNGFWPALSASMLVARAVTAEDDHTLPGVARIGFTDVVKRVVTDSTDVTTEELRAAEAAFRARIAGASPRAVCLTSSRAFDVLFPKVRTSGAWGRQPVDIEGASVWVMPSTSGRAMRHREHVHRVLDELAAYLGRDALNAPARGAA